MSRGLRLLLAAGGAWLLISGSWIHAKAAFAQILLERAWQQTIGGASNVRPWQWADTWPVARLKIPRLSASMIVLAGASGRSLAFGPGHTQGSPLPGEPGTSIVSGHRDTHFAVLKELRQGDEITIERADGRITHYEVEHLQVADARTMRIGIVGDENALVLVTCWPFSAIVPGGPFRYVVIAHRRDTSIRSSQH
ncbi:MAG: class GN sortase [Myxococcota bacterium]